MWFIDKEPVCTLAWYPEAGRMPAAHVVVQHVFEISAHAGRGILSQKTCCGMTIQQVDQSCHQVVWLEEAIRLEKKGNPLCKECMETQILQMRLLGEVDL